VGLPYLVPGLKAKSDRYKSSYLVYIQHVYSICYDSQRPLHFLEIRIPLQGTVMYFTLLLIVLVAVVVGTSTKGYSNKNPYRIVDTEQL